jgi:hypothetical protein
MSSLSFSSHSDRQIMNSHLKQIKNPVFAGIDVGAEELVLVIRKNGKPFNPQKFANTPSGPHSLRTYVGTTPSLRASFTP